MHEQCVEFEKESFSLWWWYQHNEDLLICLFWGLIPAWVFCIDYFLVFICGVGK